MLQDLRYAVRLMRRSPAFAAATILSIALGIGANTAIFSLINTLMLRPLPVQAPDELVQLLSRYPGEPRSGGFAWKYYEHFPDRNHVFSDLIAVSPVRFRVNTDEQDAEAVDGEYVVGRFFQVLGVRPAIGRLLEPHDDRAGASGAAVISWSYWQRRFNGDPQALGRSIIVNGVPVTIVGVTPRAFFGLQVGTHPGIWMPVAMEPLTQQPSRLGDGTLGVGLMGRLKPGISINQAGAEMRVLDRWRVDDLAKTRNAPFLRQMQMELEPASAGFAALRDHFAGPLLMLMAVVAALLLIACTNVAAMLLARGLARQREMAVRIAVGAGRGRLIRQMLTESLLLSAAGGLLGLWLAQIGADTLARLMVSGRGFVGMPRQLEVDVDLDGRVLLFTMAVVLANALLFGLLPALRACASAPVLRSGGRHRASGA